MSLRLATPPVGSKELLVASLRALQGAGGWGAAVEPEVTLDRVRVAAPHPIYASDPRALAAGVGLERGTLVAWRYLLKCEQVPIALAELGCEENGKGLQFANLTFGPPVLAFAETVRLVENRPEVRDGTYELRMIRMYAPRVRALWLKDRIGADDLIVPLDSVQTGPDPKPADFLHGPHAPVTPRGDSHRAFAVPPSPSTFPITSFNDAVRSEAANLPPDRSSARP